MVKRSILFGALFLCAGALFAGDVATFVNLGFSADARYFMFGEYGVADDSIPYAHLYAVDVGANRFLPEGEKSVEYRGPIEAGEDGLGAMFTLVASNVALAERYRINHLITGRELYVLIDGQAPQSHIEFRDFRTGSSYSVTLNQLKYSNDSVSSSFSLEVAVRSANGGERHYTAGLPNFKRPGVENYRVCRILLAPAGRSLIFVIQKEEKDKDGANVRYMVESLGIDP